MQSGLVMGRRFISRLWGGDYLVACAEWVNQNVIGYGEEINW